MVSMLRRPVAASGTSTATALLKASCLLEAAPEAGRLSRVARARCNRFRRSVRRPVPLSLTPAGNARDPSG